MLAEVCELLAFGLGLSVDKLDLPASFPVGISDRRLAPVSALRSVIPDSSNGSARLDASEADIRERLCLILSFLLSELSFDALISVEWGRS